MVWFPGHLQRDGLRKDGDMNFALFPPLVVFFLLFLAHNRQGKGKKGGFRGGRGGRAFTVKKLAYGEPDGKEESEEQK